MTNNDEVPSRGSGPFAAAVALGSLGSLAMPVASLAFDIPGVALAAPVLCGGLVALHGLSVLSERRRRDYLLKQLSKNTVLDRETGTSNRTGLYLLGHQMLEQVRRKGDAIHAFVADTSQVTKARSSLDDNTQSALLKVVGQALNASVRGTDVVARWDKTQFVVLGPGTGVHPGELERRVRSHLAQMEPLNVDGWPCRITVGQSSLAPWDAGDLDTLIEKAQSDYKMRRAMRAPQAPQAFFGTDSHKAG